MIRLQFSRQNDLISDEIAWFSAGDFSHVDVILPGGNLLGSRSDTVGGQHSGVQIRPPDYANFAIKVQMWAHFEPHIEIQLLDWYRSQVGKPYDHEAILGFIVNRNWRDDGSWECAELVTAGLEQFKILPTLYTPSNRVTPVCLATVISAVGFRVAAS